MSISNIACNFDSISSLRSVQVHVLRVTLTTNTESDSALTAAIKTYWNIVTIHISQILRLKVRSVIGERLGFGKNNDLWHTATYSTTRFNHVY